MENKKSKTLSLQKMKITKLDQNSISAIKGGNTFANQESLIQDCNTTYCPNETNDPFICTLSVSDSCRSRDRFCTVDM